MYISCFINFWNQEVMLPHPVVSAGQGGTKVMNTLYSV